MTSRTAAVLLNVIWGAAGLAFSSSIAFAGPITFVRGGNPVDSQSGTSSAELIFAPDNFVNAFSGVNSSGQVQLGIGLASPAGGGTGAMLTMATFTDSWGGFLAGCVQPACPTGGLSGRLQINGILSPTVDGDLSFQYFMSSTVEGGGTSNFQTGFTVRNTNVLGGLASDISVVTNPDGSRTVSGDITYSPSVLLCDGCTVAVPGPRTIGATEQLTLSADIDTFSGSQASLVNFMNTIAWTLQNDNAGLFLTSESGGTLGSPQVSPVPEPSTLALLGASLLVLALKRRRAHS